MTTQDLIDYYVALLIIQYAAQPNAQATTALFVEQAIADQLATQVENAFNFGVAPGIRSDFAIGDQLDTVANYTGAERLIYGLDLSRQYFSMPIYGQADADTQPGFALYGQSPINWYFITYENANALVYQLNDNELTRLAQFNALNNSMLQSVENVDNLLFTFFGDNVGVFETPMKITYIDLISDIDTLFGILVAAKALPRPAGVALEAIRSETITNFFGFQIYGDVINPTFVGFGLYGTPQDGSFVRYP